MAAPRKKDIPLEFRNARKGGDAEEWMIDQFGMYWNQPCMKQMPHAMLKGVCIMVPPFAVMGLLMLFVMCLAAREKKSKQKALDAKKPDAKKPEQSKEKRSKKTD